MSKKITSTSKDKGIKSTKVKAVELARQHGIDALLDGQKPASTYTQRATARQQMEMGRQQQNLEQILVLVEKLCGDEAGSDIDPDWFTAYLSLACHSQSPAMQQLWAQILVREIAAPGSFSVRALKVLTEMTQREAQWFQRACQLSSRLGSDQNRKLIVGAIMPASRMGLRRARLSKLLLSKHRLSYSQLMQLAELGLLFERELETTIPAGQDLMLNQGSQPWLLRPRAKGIRLLYQRMTPIGDELAELIPDEPVETYQQELTEQLGRLFEIQR